MGEKRSLWARLADYAVNQPFRAIEFLVSVPLFFYGLYLSAGLYAANVIGGGVFTASSAPELNAEISGILYMLTGAALLWAAISGVQAARKISAMAMFFSMLWSIIFRTVEVGFLPGSLILFYIALVTAGIDFVQLIRTPVGGDE